MGSVADRFKKKEQRMRGTIGHTAIPGIGSTAIVRERTPMDQIDRRYRLEDWQVREAFTKFKYIVAVHPMLGEVALPFPSYHVHADMARNVFPRLEIVAAGFYELWPDKSIRVHGRSESLDIDSRRDLDGPLIEKAMGLSD